MAPWWDGRVDNDLLVPNSTPNNPDDKPDDPNSNAPNNPDPNPLPNNQDPQINANVSPLGNPNPENQPGDALNLSGGESTVSLEPGCAGLTSGRRKRGRPPGSKNRTKIPVDVATTKSHVLEMRSGSDITEVLATFAVNHKCGISILSAAGIVSSVKLRRAVSSSVVNLSGHFDIVSLSGSFLLASSPSGASGLTVCLADGQGQVVGGRVVGPLLAFGPVFIVVMLINPTHENLSSGVEHEGMGGSGSTSLGR